MHRVQQAHKVHRDLQELTVQLLVQQAHKAHKAHRDLKVLLVQTAQ